MGRIREHGSGTRVQAAGGRGECGEWGWRCAGCAIDGFAWGAGRGEGGFAGGEGRGGGGEGGVCMLIGRISLGEWGGDGGVLGRWTKEGGV